MDAARVFSERINFKVVISLTCVLFFIGAFFLVSWFQVQNKFTNMQCYAPFRFFETHQDKSWLEVRGIYRLDSRSGIEGKTSYVGKVSYYDSKGELKNTIPVSREIDWKVKMSNSYAVTEITATNRRVGDHSDDNLVRDYIFPTYSVGQLNNSTVFLLNGKVLANGPDSVPRIMCEN